jgi:hypothetical protein
MVPSVGLAQYVEPADAVKTDVSTTAATAVWYMRQCPNRDKSCKPMALNTLMVAVWQIGIIKCTNTSFNKTTGTVCFNPLEFHIHRPTFAQIFRSFN